MEALEILVGSFREPMVIKSSTTSCQELTVASI